MDGLLPSGGKRPTAGTVLMNHMPGWWRFKHPVNSPVEGKVVSLLIHGVDDTSQLNSRISEPSTVWSLRGHIQLLPRYGIFKSHLEIPWETLSIVNTSIVTGASANPPGFQGTESTTEGCTADSCCLLILPKAGERFTCRHFFDVVVLTSDHIEPTWLYLTDMTMLEVYLFSHVSFNERQIWLY